VREDALPPRGHVLMTFVGCVVFEAVTGKVVDNPFAARFYPGVVDGGGTLVWATRRRPTHEELVRASACTARTEPSRVRLRVVAADHQVTASGTAHRCVS